MEALEFLKEANRICKKQLCNKCPVKGKCLYNPNINHNEDKIKEIVSAVEQWSKEHPVQTNAQKFEEVFGEKRLSDLIDCKIRNALEEETIVDIQKTKWWDKPYKEPEND